PGEGEFLVKWKGHQQATWMNADGIFETGLTAVRKYFQVLREKRHAEERRHLDRLTHISSLHDILTSGIVQATETSYKLKIAGFTNDFLYELNHPEWGKNITKTLEIVREKDGVYVWVNHLQVRYVFQPLIAAWQKRDLSLPTHEEINKMSKEEYLNYLAKKKTGSTHQNMRILSRRSKTVNGRLARG
ncbi:hypothetical protein PENTCL1PPCAC_25872, partial [Pristionchus entomophagus]